MNECSYGCGNPATVYFKTVSRWCCEKNAKACPANKQRQKQTCIEKYGHENPSQSAVVKKKRKETNKGVDWKSVAARRKLTCLEKYGYENPSRAPEINEKRNSTFRKKYGKHPLKCDHIRDKIKVTNLEKYGYENPSHSDAVNQKRRDWWENLPREDLKLFIDGVLSTKQHNGQIFNVSDDELSDYKSYRRRVTVYTNRTYKEHIDVINPNGYVREMKGWHLDHKYSILDGYINGVLPEIIGSLYNLQMLRWDKNISKGKGSCIELEYLMEKYNERT